MKNVNEVSEAYLKAKKGGQVEYAILDFPKSSAIRKANVLKLMDLAGIPIPSESISGSDLDRIIFEYESRGINIPGIRLSKVETRSLVDSIKKSGITFESENKRMTKNLTSSQKKLYDEFLRLKAKADGIK